MGYKTKFVRRAVKKRKRLLAEPVRWIWLLTLECGHVIQVPQKIGPTVQRPVCPECNQAAMDQRQFELMMK